jgi:hypothetical protein
VFHEDHESFKLNCFVVVVLCDRCGRGEEGGLDACRLSGQVSEHGPSDFPMGMLDVVADHGGMFDRSRRESPEQGVQSGEPL